MKGVGCLDLHEFPQSNPIKEMVSYQSIATIVWWILCATASIVFMAGIGTDLMFASNSCLLGVTILGDGKYLMSSELCGTAIKEGAAGLIACTLVAAVHGLYHWKGKMPGKWVTFGLAGV